MDNTLINLMISLIPAILLCFFGLKLRKVALAIIWFLIGWNLAGSIATSYLTGEFLIITVQIAVALICAAVSFSLEKTSIFIALFAVGFISVYMLTPHVWYYILLAAVVGVVLGILSIKLYKPVIILTTSYSGAATVAPAIISHFALANDPYYLLILLGVMIVGALFQFSNNRNVPVTGY